MDFGQVRVPPPVIPPLPPLVDRASPAIAPGLARREPGAFDLQVGLPIWGATSWVGEFYPRGTRAADALREYGARVPCVELNSSFYRVPEASTASRWAAQTPDHFRFVTKFPKDISQDPLLRIDQPEVLEHAIAAFEVLGRRWGGGFLQLPPSFAPESFGLLSRWLNGFRRMAPEVPFAMEFRHPGWFEGRQLVPRLADLLSGLRVSSVITDTLGVPGVSHGTATADWVMVRFLGLCGDPSDAVRLERWARRIQEWKDAGLRRTSFFIHQPTDPWMPKTLKPFIRLLESKGLLRPASSEDLDRGMQIPLL